MAATEKKTSNVLPEFTNNTKDKLMKERYVHAIWRLKYLNKPLLFELCVQYEHFK